MLSLLLVTLLIVASAVAVLYQGAALYWAAAMPRLDPETTAAPEPLPSWSVVIAARNEAEDLPACLGSLVAQEFHDVEIYVVDGGSTDGTPELVRSRFPSAHLLPEPPIPAGWVGKNWACATGARLGRGDWILFLDADVRLAPGALATALRWAVRERADLATLAPRVEMRTFWEKLILPFYVQAVLTYFRAPRVNRDRSRAAMANGQFLLVRRSAYEAVGGHAAVRAVVLEDVALARRFRARGFRLRIAWAPDLLATRMYRDRGEMTEGILKNIHGIEFSALRQVGFLAALLGFYLLPLGVLPLGLATGSLLLTGVGAFLYVALFGKHAVFARAIRGSFLVGLLYPLAVAYYLGLVGRSLGRGLVGRPVRWKGREYPVRATGPADDGRS